MVGWVVTAQISSLLRELPKYSQNIKAKAKSLKQVAASSNRLTKMLVEINQELGSGTSADGREGSKTRGSSTASASESAGASHHRAAEPGLAVADLDIPGPADGVSRRAGPGNRPGHFHASEARGAAQSHHPAGGTRADRGRHQVCRRGRPADQPILADASDRQHVRSG